MTEILGSKTDQGSCPGKNPEACKRWNNGKCFKPCISVLFVMGHTKTINCPKLREGDLSSYGIIQLRNDYWIMGFILQTS